MPCEIDYQVLKTVIDNPSQVDLFFKLMKYSCRNSYLKLIEVMIDPLYKNQEIMNLYQNNYELSGLDMDYLKTLPPDTLGYQYADFLIQNNLQSDYYPQIRKRNLLSHIKSLLWQSHDLWHVVCGYDTSMPHEAALQAFILAQVQSPLALVMLAAIMIHIAIKQPEEITNIMNMVVLGYEKGKLANNLLSVNWHLLFTKNLQEVRKELNIDVSADHIYRSKSYGSAI